MSTATAYILCVGNVFASSPEASVIAVYCGQEPPELMESSDLAATIDELADRYRSVELTCSPDLAMLAGPRGIRVAPWNRKTLSRRAALALRLAYGRPFLEITDDQLLVSLINAAARLASANKDSDRFWRISEQLSGTEADRRVGLAAALIAATSPATARNNISMFASRNDADAYFQSVTPWQGAPPPVRTITLDLVEGYPPALRHAVLGFTNTPIVPAVLVRGPGGESSLTDTECAVLAATTFALADLCEHPDRTASSTVFAVRELTLSAQLQVELARVASGQYHGALGWWQ